MIRVLRPGLLTTVQDGGREGLRAFGVPLAGAADRRAWAAANALAGNAPGAAALELTLQGGTFRFEAAAFAALCGADMGATLGGVPLDPWSSFAVAAGEVLALGSCRRGARAYLAVRGGLDVPVVLGSRSTDLRAGMGGLGGRALVAGDLLALGEAAVADPPPRAVPARLRPPLGSPVELRVLPGPDRDHFRREGVAAFHGSTFAVTNENDRMGYRLEGPPVAHRSGADVVSDPLLPGAVQVPGNGMPIVVHVDCQTAGGYARIATVIGPDLSRIAQGRAGDLVRFRRVREEEALAALRTEREELAALESGEAWSARRRARRGRPR